METTRYLFFKCFILCACIALVLSSGIARATVIEVIDITQFGVTPDAKQNTTLALRKALNYCQNRSGVKLRFPRGRYDFWPTEGNNGHIAFKIEGAENLTIEGDSSSFIFHGEMEIARMNAVQNITWQNFTVDWERPYISQAQIESYTGTTLDLRIDYEKYPYVIENDTLFFLGEGWKLPVLNAYNNLYDKETKDLLYNTWDYMLGDIFQKKAEEIEKGLVRLHCGELRRLYPEKGTYVALMHMRYGHKGFAVTNSKDVVYRNMKVYHTLGMAFIATRTENITFENAYVAINEQKGRVFSAIADATHLGFCKGIVTLDGVKHAGQADDFLNIHGGHCQISQIIDANTIEIDRNTPRKFGSGYGSGDKVWFIDEGTKQRGKVRTIKSHKTVTENGKEIATVITFQEVLPENVAVGDFIENKTWNPDVIIRNCVMARKSRARGILLTTPGNILVENNYFSTAGPAIWLEADFTHWYESGAVNNLIIRNNVFENCLTSGNRDGYRYQGGYAVITIAPSVRPGNNHSLPFHRNIQISENTFHMFDRPILYARSVGGLIFSHNTIHQTNTFPAYAYQKTAWALEGCRNVVFEANTFDKQFDKRIISVNMMQESDIRVAEGQQITIEPGNGIFLF